MDLHPATSWKAVSPGLFLWEIDSAFHGAPLTSHAVVAAGRLFVFDPIPLAEPAFSDLASAATPAVIVLTNENHERAAADWGRRLRAPIWADTAAAARLGHAGVRALPSDDTFWEGWELHRIPGAGTGEIALRRPELSLAVVGDALVHLPGRELEVYPVSEGNRAEDLRRGLRQLATLPFDHLLMAHGAPLLEQASARVLELLGPA